MRLDKDLQCMQILEGLIQSIPPDHAVVLIALSQPPSAYSYLFKSQVFTPPCIIDCFTDPYAWKMMSKSSGSTFPLFAGDSSSEAVINSLTQKITAIHPERTKISLVFDCINPMIDYFGVHSIARFLQTLRHHPCICSLCTLLHEDGFGTRKQQESVSLCTYNASCTLTLSPAQGLIDKASMKSSLIHKVMGADRDSTNAHGKLTIRMKKRSGCIKVEHLEYWVLSSTRIECVGRSKGHAVPQHPTATLKSDPNSGQNAAESNAAASVAHQFAGGMKLNLSEEEIAARNRVQLPYEHQGQNSLYSTSDYRDYLPTEAGGNKQGEGRLGHILYVRDSDSEPDSDEDPDDDLDI